MLSEKNESSLERLAENDGKSKAERMKLKQTVRGSVLKWTTLFKVNHDGFLAIEERINFVKNSRELYLLVVSFFRLILYFIFLKECEKFDR